MVCLYSRQVAHWKNGLMKGKQILVTIAIPFISIGKIEENLHFKYKFNLFLYLLSG